MNGFYTPPAAVLSPPCSGSERSEASVAARGGGYQVKRARAISVDNSGCKTIPVSECEDKREDVTHKEAYFLHQFEGAIIQGKKPDLLSKQKRSSMFTI